jgi:hypothetical protein
MEEAAMRPIDVLLDQYSEDHRNETNQLVHLLCVPAIVWSVTAFLWTIPVPATWFRPGAFAGFAMVAGARLVLAHVAQALGRHRDRVRAVRLAELVDRRETSACAAC